MNQGFINRIKAQIAAIDAYLEANQGKLSEEQLNEALDKRSELTDLLELFK